MNYSVNVNKDNAGRYGGFTRYNVSREGGNINVQDTSAEGRRHLGDDYSLTVAADTITIRSQEKNYDIQMSPDGVTVSDPGAAGFRGGMGDVPITGFTTEMPLKPEQYEQVGLSIASSLIGIPLVFPAG